MVSSFAYLLYFLAPATFTLLSYFDTFDLSSHLSYQGLDNKVQQFGSHVGRTALDISVDINSHDGHISSIGQHEEGPAVTSTPQAHIKSTSREPRSHQDLSDHLKQTDDIEWDFGSDDEQISGNVIVKTIRTIYGDPNAAEFDELQNAQESSFEVKRRCVDGQDIESTDVHTKPIITGESLKGFSKIISELPIPATRTQVPEKMTDVMASLTRIDDKDLSDFLINEEKRNMDSDCVITEEINFKGGDIVENLAMSENGISPTYLEERHRRTSTTVNSDSDADSDSRVSPMGDRRLLSRRKTIGSSSGSDIALHEGNDLSDDEHAGTSKYLL